MMNDKYSPNDFREEELFKEFLEKHNIQNNAFSPLIDSSDEIFELEEINEADKYDDEIKTLSDILPDSLDSKEENVRRISCLLILGFLVLMLCINILLPSKDISEKENRALAQFPRI